MALFAAVPVAFAGIAKWFLAVMAGWKAWIGFYIVTYAGAFAISALKALGVGYVTYELGGFALDQIYNVLMTKLGTMPEMILVSLKTMGLFEFLTIYFGGATAAMALRGFMNNARRSRMTTSRPQEWIT